MKMSVDHAELTREAKASAQFKRILERAAWAVVKSVSDTLMAQIKMTMPVDTGRAQGSWGKTTGGVATPADSYWQENRTELWIEQGTTVYYVAYLEQGSSNQAPAGFIEGAAMAAHYRLDDYITQMVADVLWTLDPT